MNAARKPRPNKRPKQRPRRGPRQSTITVYQIHCKACTKRYELAYTGEVKFCIYCASEKIEKSLRTRAETNAERAQRKAEFDLHFLNMVGSVLNGLFGSFAPHPGFAPQPPRNGKPSSALEAELMKEGYRKLATKYHPDKGGDPEKMKELNRLKERLGL
jgi:hypothetical protein